VITGVRDEGLSAVLERIGFRPEDGVALCHRPLGGRFHLADFVPASEAARVAAVYEAGDVWFGVNPQGHKPSYGRGAGVDITRLAALYADLDVKDGGLPDLETCQLVINALSGVLRTRPVVVIHSGHGLQPLWAIDPDDEAAHLTNGEKRAYATALLRRFGRLAAHVAALYGGSVDAVSILPEC